MAEMPSFANRLVSWTGTANAFPECGLRYPFARHPRSRFSWNYRSRKTALVRAQQIVAMSPARAAFCSSSARFASSELPPVKRVTAASRNGVTLAPRNARSAAGFGVRLAHGRLRPGRATTRTRQAAAERRAATAFGRARDALANAATICSHIVGDARRARCPFPRKKNRGVRRVR